MLCPPRHQHRHVSVFITYSCGMGVALTLTTWVRDNHFEGVQKKWVWELMFCLLGQYVFHGTFGTYCDNGMLCPMDGNPGGLAGSGAGHWPCHLAPFPVEDVVRLLVLS